MGGWRPWSRDGGADVGFAVDPDVDRLALIDETGHAIGEDYTLALAASVVLKRQSGPGGHESLDQPNRRRRRREAGVPVIRTPVGEVNVAIRMRTEGAPVGGEGNGGVIVAGLHLGRDAPAGAALILQLLTDAGSALVGDHRRWPRYAIVKDKLDRPGEPARRVYDAAGRVSRARGRFAGRSSAGLARSLGARAAEWYGTDRAGHCRGADGSAGPDLVARARARWTANRRMPGRQSTARQLVARRPRAHLAVQRTADYVWNRRIRRAEEVVTPLAD